MADELRTVEGLGSSGGERSRDDSDPGDITQHIDDVSPRALRYGGTADVYQGTWRRAAGDIQVALKVFRVVNPGDLAVQRRLRREIYIWQRLVHPNVHKLCGLYENLGPLPALVSEWCGRGDIKQYLNTLSGNADLAVVKLNLILDVAHGLEYLHGREIVHGDIKGANVLISNDGTARLSDFGFSVLLADYSQSLTQTSNIHGTYRWMAPELVLDEGARHSYASDIWAFGCLAIEVHSGRVPYHTRRNYLQVITALARSEPPLPPPTVPDFLAMIAYECCNFIPEQRPAASNIVAHIQPQGVLSRISFMITRGHPMEKTGEILLGLIAGSFNAASAHQPALYRDLSAMSDTELAAIAVRRLAVWSAVVSSSSNPYDINILQWCLDKIIGTGNLSLQSIRRLTSSTVGLENSEERDVTAAYPSSALHSLAKLLAVISPAYAKGLMLHFATASISEFALYSYVLCVAWFPDASRVALGLGDGTVRVLNTATGADLYRLVGHTDYIRNVAVSQTGKLVASCSDDKSIRLWDAETEQAIGAPLSGHTDWVLSVAFSPAGWHIVSGSEDATIRVWSTETCTTVLGPLHGHSDSVWSVAYHPDGSRIISGSFDRTVRVWNALTGNPIMTLCGHTGIIRSVAYSPDGLCIVSSSDDDTIRIWNAATGLPTGIPLRGHRSWVWSVAYSADGKRIVSGSIDRTIRIWDVATGSSIATLHGHTEPVYSVAFSPDGTQLASASPDATLRIWDATDEWARWDT